MTTPPMSATVVTVDAGANAAARRCRARRLMPATPSDTFQGSLEATSNRSVKVTGCRARAMVLFPSGRLGESVSVTGAGR